MSTLFSTLASNVGPQQKFWFRHNASTFGDTIDPIYFYIFWVSAFFFVLLMALMVYFGVKYRRKPGVAPQPSASHNTLLELSWSVIPTLLMAVMFYWGFKGYIVTRVAPADAETVFVNAQKWSWTLEYPGGVTSKDTDRLADVDAPVFAIPTDRPVNFVMTSADVIHSFYVPAFRTKRDIFPNRYTNLWVKALDRPTHTCVEKSPGNFEVSKINQDEEGYTLFCTEYCGDQHSQMVGRVIVLDGPNYQNWIKKQSDTSGIDLVTLGRMMWSVKGCNACHTTNGAKNTGPTWQGIWGETHEFQDGSKIKVDYNYIRESILLPAAHVRTGFANQMVSYEGKVTEREIRAIAQFIKSLNPALEAEAKSEAEAELAEQKAKKEAGAAGTEAPATTPGSTPAPAAAPGGSQAPQH